MVHRVRRDHGGLAGLQYDVAIADQDAHASGEDLEPLLLMRMNVPVLAPQQVLRIRDGLVHRVHSEDLAVRLLPGRQDLQRLRLPSNDLPLEVALATGPLVQAVATIRPPAVATRAKTMNTDQRTS